MPMKSSRMIHPTPVGQTRVRWPSPAAIANRAPELPRVRSGTSSCDLNDWRQAEWELIEEVVAGRNFIDSTVTETLRRLN
jgi:hypothetical protein